MAELRDDLPPLPDRFLRLPISERGYPVPWFVSWLDDDGEPLPRGEGKPEFRILAPGAVAEAWNRQKCWLCGERTGRHVAFILGCMCAVNRVNSEPPSHRDCADFAARACPFLVRPHAKRRPVERDGEAFGEMPGTPILRNPGVAVVWVTERKRIRPFKVDNGWLFDVGEPNEVRWYCEGRPADREEIEHSVETGLPLLQEAVAKEPTEAAREMAGKALESQLERARELMPA